jgi:hypothetical protein
MRQKDIAALIFMIKEEFIQDAIVPFRNALISIQTYINLKQIYINICNVL